MHIQATPINYQGASSYILRHVEDGRVVEKEQRMRKGLKILKAIATKLLPRDR